MKNKFDDQTDLKNINRGTSFVILIYLNTIMIMTLDT